MDLPLLSTKFFLPPPQPGLVSRRRLLDRLDEGLQPGKRLVLVSAPAGYGKTTLLGEWIQSLRDTGELPNRVQFAWLSLDEGDNDPLRFWIHLVAALQKIHPSVGQDALSALCTVQTVPIQFILTGLINDLTLVEGLAALVLDDYHFITNPQIHTGIAFLVEYLPPGLRLVLATRADPPLPVVQLRARRQMVELRAADLRFTSQEAAAFLNEMMGLGLLAEDVEALEARTEGWAVGLQLAALSMQGRKDRSGFIQAFSGSHFFILEYLVEEVLNRQPEELHSFLLQTSVLDRLSGPLCDAVLDEGRMTSDESSSSFVFRPSSSVVLESLHRLNLFVIPLDDERHWYRYHHLFADLLRNQLRQKVSAQEVAALHRRASAWCEANGLLDEAVRHGLEAGDFERVAGMVERAAKANMLNGRVTTILHWMNALPEALHRSRPRLQLYHGWACFLNGQTDLAERMLLSLKGSLLVQMPVDEDRSILGELNAYLATLMSVAGKTGQMLQVAQEALADLPAEEYSARARAYSALGSAYGLDGRMEASHQALQEAAHLAQLAGNAFLYAHVQETAAGNYVHQGRLRAAARIYQEIVNQAEGPRDPDSPPSPADARGSFLAGIGYLGLAEVTLEWNDLELASSQLQKGLDLCRQGGILYNLFNGFMIRAHLLSVLGDRRGAVATYRQVEELYRTSRSLPFAVLLSVNLARLKLWEEGIQTILDWSGPDRRISPLDLPVENLPISVREVQLISQARLYLHAGQPERVVEIDERVCSTAKPGDRLARVIEISLLKALALHELDDLPGALVALERSLVLSGPEGYLRLYLDEGEPARRLLTHLTHLYRSRRSSGTNPPAMEGYIDRILDAFSTLPSEAILESYRSKTPPLDVPISPGLIEPLSARELEVLHLIAAGHTNQEIASQLVVSLNTVKKHTSNLFSKLGATSRTQATAIARQLGLL